MSYFPLPMPKWGNGGESSTGAPFPGGKVYTYAAGTSTPLPTYTDATGGTPNANPTILDSAGRAELWVAAGVAYKIVLKDSTDVTVWTSDNVSVPNPSPAPAPSNIPIGGVILYGAAAAPSGYLLCDGTAYSRSTYADLFAAIGTTYGVGNGSTTFNVPDLRQRFPMGVAASGTGNVLGATGGTIDHVHSGPSHVHTVAAHAHTIAHTHSVPHNGWSDALATPPVDGILQSGGSGSGEEAAVTQATADNTTGASSAANSGNTSLTTDAGGTGNTGTANAPFQTFTFIIKT